MGTSLGEQRDVPAFKESDERYSCHKSSDVSEERYASALYPKAHSSAQELAEKPDAQHDGGRHVGRSKEGGREQDQHPSAWKYQKIGPENS